MQSNLPTRRSLWKRWLITDPSIALEDQFFQTLSALSGFLCIFVITPINYFQNLSPWIDRGIVAFGLVSAAISWSARKGRFYKRTLIVSLVGLLDLIWFPNCGTQGSVGFYFFAAALFIVIFFSGKQRTWGLVLLIVNIIVMLVIERARPNLPLPFSSTLDRLIDLTSGYVISISICSLILWVIQSGFNRERVRVKGVLHTLGEREAELRAVFESSQQAIAVCKGGALELVNHSFLSMFHDDKAEDLYGVSLADLVEIDARELSSDQDPDGRAGPIPPRTREVLCKRSDGSRFPAHLSISSYQLDATAHTVISLVDLTEHKRVEQQQQLYEAQARRNEKMDSLGALAGGVAHDMNNVLAAVMGLASVHLAEASAGSVLHQDMETIVNACLRGGSMVKGLLAFARDNLPVRRELDLNLVVQESVALLERTTLQRIRIQVDLAADLAALQGDPAALAHALMNLCVNAVDAMPGGGSLTLRTWNHDESTVALEVVDTGGGMPKEVLDRALEPFFTTKPMGKGTGLGLPIVFGTVKAHHGRMEIVSDAGRGTRVVLYLPAQRGETREPPTQISRQSIPPVRTLNVLLVDDDELVQHAVHRILRSMGHVVTTVDGGSSALSVVESGLVPDLVILDMNMPELDGAATLPRLRELLPDVPVVLTTGRADERAMDLVSSYSNVTMLPKPFRADDLGTRVALAGCGTRAR